MTYQQATSQEIQKIYDIVQHTIKTIYPKYYPLEIVDFFSNLHSMDAILKDVDGGNVGVLVVDDEIVGTGSFVDNHITRVYVLPEYQKKGYGTFIIKSMELEISKKYDKAYLDASLPAVTLYEKLGYQTKNHEKYLVENGVILTYEVMEKIIYLEENKARDRRSKLIVLRGNSGSGKTTLAKELQKKFGRNTMLISQDVVRREILCVKDEIDSKAIPLLQELLCYGRAHSEVVILEGIMYADWYKPLFEVAKQEFGENIFAYYFDIPFEETLRRHQTKSNCNDFGETDMRGWWREKDYTDVFDEYKIMEKEMLEIIVKAIYEKVINLTI